MKTLDVCEKDRKDECFVQAPGEVGIWVVVIGVSH